MRTIHHFGKALTFLLIVFEISLIWLRRGIGDSEMQAIAHWIWLVLLVYLNIQLLETSRRDPTNQMAFFLDNSLAFLAVVAAIVLWTLRIQGSELFRYWRREEVDILLECTAFTATDFLWGILFAMRIAFAGKERGEYERRAHND